MLNENEQHELVQVARTTLETFLTTGKSPEFDGVSKALHAQAGAFVTLHAGEKLRGCIGTFSADTPLYETVKKMAVASATNDPRFSAVTADELESIQIEISVLSPLKKVNADEVEVGRHGLEISGYGRRGVLLPQVATEHGWDRETFLQQTCYKAGLPLDAWKESETVIEVFEAQVIKEQ